MSEFKVSEVVGQAVVRTTSLANVSAVSGNYMLQRVVPGNISEIVGQYMRDSRVLDMSKPMYISEVYGQIVTQVLVATKVTEVAVIVLQAQEDRVIRTTPGGLQQKRIY